MRSYEAARSLFSFLAFCAWVTIIVGVLITLGLAMAAGEMSGYGRGPTALAFFLATLPGLAVALVGFLFLAIVQNGRASVDTAELTQQMLQIVRDQLQVSRQSLSKSDQIERSFAALQVAPVPSATASFASVPVAPTTMNSTSRDEQSQIAVGSETEYRGKKILRIAEGFRFRGLPFASLDEARVHIDELLEPESAKKLGGQSRST